jgi:hypothetical protein
MLDKDRLQTLASKERDYKEAMLSDVAPATER